jgi:hypothetical protein
MDMRAGRTRPQDIDLYDSHSYRTGRYERNPFAIFVPIAYTRILPLQALSITRTVSRSGVPKPQTPK